MGFRLDGWVGTNQMTDGNQAGALTRFARDGSMVVAESHGKFYEQASRGNMYIAQAPAIALIIAATTGGHPTLWNPLGSGVNAEIVRVSLTWVTGANSAIALIWAITAPAGATYATGAPIATWVNVAPQNVLPTSAKVSSMKWAPATNTFSAAPAYLCGIGVGLGNAAPTVVPEQINIDYDGMLVIPPGVALSLCSLSGTTTATYLVTIYYIEQAV